MYVDWWCVVAIAIYLLAGLMLAGALTTGEEPTPRRQIVAFGLLWPVTMAEGYLLARRERRERERAKVEEEQVLVEMSDLEREAMRRAWEEAFLGPGHAWSKPTGGS